MIIICTKQNMWLFPKVLAILNESVVTVWTSIVDFTHMKVQQFWIFFTLFPLLYSIVDQVCSIPAYKWRVFLTSEF